jgi:hypothetical protein
MNRNILVMAGAMLFAGVVCGQQEPLDPEQMPAGSRVRLIANKPVINLARAEVVECTPEKITVVNKKDRFTVAASNLVELVVLSGPKTTLPLSPRPNGRGADTNPKMMGQPEPATQAATNQVPAKKTFWQKVTDLWK